jgi:hypothetical protein
MYCPGPHGHLLAVDGDGAGAMDDGIHVLGSVADVVVPYGFPARWKLNLIEPNARIPSACPTPLSCGLAAGCGPGTGFIRPPRLSCRSSGSSRPFPAAPVFLASQDLVRLAGRSICPVAFFGVWLGLPRPGRSG